MTLDSVVVPERSWPNARHGAANGPLAFRVPSRSRPGLLHTVTIRRDLRPLCGCEAALHCRVCRHVCQVTVESLYPLLVETKDRALWVFGSADPRYHAARRETARVREWVIRCQAWLGARPAARRQEEVRP